MTLRQVKLNVAMKKVSEVFLCFIHSVNKSWVLVRWTKAYFKLHAIISKVHIQSPTPCRNSSLGVPIEGIYRLS